MDTFNHYLSKVGFEDSEFRKYLMMAALTLGLVQIASWCLRFVSFAFRHTLKRPLNFN